MWTHHHMDMPSIIVRPFEIAVPQEVLDRIVRQVGDARIGYAPDDDDGSWSFGTDARYLTDLVAYWRDEYDWRAVERTLNQWPHFKAAVDGIDIHFQHVRGSGDTGRAVILTHGWPGSIVEFQDTIERLAFPERFGGRSQDGLDVVVPSLPGFGWSGRPSGPIGARRVAAMWRTLMTGLGYPRFGAQGGDWGSAVTVWLGADHADVVSGIHLNFVTNPPPGPEDDADCDTYRSALKAMLAREGAYMHEQVTKPQTIGLALHDNPVGAAAWMIEKFHGWGDTHGDIESRFSKEHLITNVMTYLVNDAMISAFWAYRGIAMDSPFEGRVRVPTAIAHFPAEFYPWPTRRNVERLYDVRRWTEMPAGGHFAAMEEPVLFCNDVLAFFHEVD